MGDLTSNSNLSSIHENSDSNLLNENNLFPADNSYDVSPNNGQNSRSLSSSDISESDVDELKNNEENISNLNKIENQAESISLGDNDRFLNVDPQLNRENTAVTSQYNFQLADDGHNMTELVVLDPEHSLMIRFQNALKEMLTNQRTKMILEEREITEDLKKHRTEHIESGTELFTVQRELAQFQTQLGQLYDDFEEAKQARMDIGNELVDRKKEYKEVTDKYTSEYNRMQNQRTEMDNLGLRLYYLKNAQKDIKGDIAVMKRAAEKAVVDLTKVEKEKMQQDYLLDALVTESDKLKEDISLYEAQIIAQEDEKCAASQTVRQAENEINAIITDRRKLANMWNSSLLDLSRRNEALNDIKNHLREVEQNVLTYENEISAYKRTVHDAQNVNEQLTLILKKSEADLKNIQKYHDESKSKNESIQIFYNQNLLILQQTEIELAKINKEKHAQEIRTNDFYRKYEELNRIKYDFEDKIENTIRDKLRLESVKATTERLTLKHKDQSRELESKVVKLDNLLSKNALEIAEIQTETKELDKFIQLMTKESDEKNELLNKMEQEIKRSKVTLGVKQDLIDRLNAQYFTLLNERGGEETGPLEIIINTLTKEILLANENASNSEQNWLREQQELVKLVNIKEELNSTINRLKQQYMLISQKKIRIAGQIATEERQINEFTKDLKYIQNQMLKINRLIANEKTNGEFIEEKLSFAETDFIRELKEEEIATAQLQSQIEDVEQDKDEILRETVEVQWQIMMIEKKIQLVTESRKILKSGIAQAELEGMRKEIHRMELRYNQLKQQQEMLIQGMEKSVTKRDVITQKVESLEKLPDKVTTKMASERNILGIKRKIKQYKKSAKECEERTDMLKFELEMKSEDTIKVEKEIEEANKKLTDLKSEYEEYCDKKYSMSMELQYIQQMNKYFADLKEKKYIRAYKTAPTLKREKNKFLEKVHNYNLVVDRLMSEYPQVQRGLKPIYDAVQFNSNEIELN